MLVGRQQELATFDAILSRVSTGGGLCLFSGEPGIGKTRLAMEVAAVARSRGFGVSFGRCWEAGGAPPFWPWREALDGLGLEFPRAASVLAADPSEARFALFRAVERTLTHEARRHPLLLVLEDLHAADQPALALLEFIAGQAQARPIVLVGTYRDVEARLRPDTGEAIARLERAGKSFRLQALTEPDVAALVRDTLADASAEVVGAVYEVTRGNPLFVEEMVRDRRTPPAERGSAVPLGVREIIRQRLGRVPGRVRPLLDAAAVLGVDVPLAVLRRITDDVESLLDDASRSGLVVARDARLRFSHSLYREGLYHDLPRAQRQALHRASARALAEVGASLDEIAHHLFEGGPDAASDAIEHAIKAAARAVEDLAFEEANVLLARASASVPTGRDEGRLRGSVLIAQGEARIRSGDATGRELCAQAAAIARELGDAPLLASAGLAYGSVFFTGGVDPFLVGVLEDALSRLPHADSALRARVMARLAAARQPSLPEERPRDIELREEAVAMARRLGDRRVLLTVLHSASGVLYGAADPSVRLPIMLELERLAEELGDTARLLHARVRLAIDHLELADFAAYEALASSYEALAQRLGPAAEPWRVPLMRSMLALRHDRFDDSLRFQAESRSIEAERPRARRAQAFHRICFFRAAERHAELRAALAELKSLWLAMPYGVALADARVASALARIGADAEVRELLARIPHAAFKEEINALALAEAVWLVGDTARAKDLYPILLLYQTRWGMYWFDCEIVEAPATRLIAYVAGLVGDWEACDRFFQRGLAAVEAVGCRSMAARMRFELGDLLVRFEREPARARELLMTAHALAREVGLSELVGLIEQRHARTGARSSRPPEPASRSHRFEMLAEGEYFTIPTERGVLRFKASLGMQYLARLVAQPSVALHVLELTGSSGHADRGDAGEVLDADAVRAYHVRLRTLHDVVESAEARGNADAAERARDEMETIARQLAGGKSRGGRLRRAQSAVDRARSAVQRRLKDAVQRIAEQDRALGEWLSDSVVTGNHCVFRPRR